MVPVFTDIDFAHRAFQLRPASSTDFRFAWSLYKELVLPLAVELLGEWYETGQKRIVDLALAQKGTSIIVVDGLDAGWMQVVELPESAYLRQLYLAPAFQNRRIGTIIITELIGRARVARKLLMLTAMKNNRARVFYERLGFQVVDESEHILTMRWQESAFRRTGKLVTFPQWGQGPVG